MASKVAGWRFAAAMCAMLGMALLFSVRDVASTFEQVRGAWPSGAKTVATGSTVGRVANATRRLSTRCPYLGDYEGWKTHFQMEYASQEAEQHAMHNFLENDDYIRSNLDSHQTYTLCHNQFSGMNWSEWVQYERFAEQEFFFRSFNSNTTQELLNHDPSNNRRLNFGSYPSSIDWRTRGAVTRVKNQGRCGSCWSFSATGALEGALFILNGRLVSLSEQNLIDCDYTSSGCNGGRPVRAFKWIKKNGGLCTEADYPYTSRAGTCSKCQKIAALVQYRAVERKSDPAMQTALAKQPVSISIQADQYVFQLYSSGVFTDQCGTLVDHAMLAVGYGTEGGEDYYIIKNSWGVSWGERGYIRLGRGKKYNDGKGQCGMLMEPSYPQLVFI